MRGDLDACYERALAMLPAWERAAWNSGLKAAGKKKKALNFATVAEAAGARNWYDLDFGIQMRAKKMFNCAIDFAQHHGETQVFSGTTKLNRGW